MTSFLFLIGLMLLWPASELVIRGSLMIAGRLKLSVSLIGLTVIAIGTGLPELAVSFSGLFNRAQGTAVAGLVLGNAIGSVMSLITLMIGLIGTVSVLKWHREDIVENGIALIGVMATFFVMSIDLKISWWEAWILLAIYVVYLWRLAVTDKRKKLFGVELLQGPLWRGITELALGLVVVIAASNLVVTQGVALATTFGVSQAVVGVLLIGLGTSLPELVISVWSLIRNQPQLTISNIFGSSIFNICMAVGLTGIVNGWQIAERFVRYDIPIMVVASLVLVAFFYTRQRVERREAVLLVAFYVSYAIFVITTV